MNRKDSSDTRAIKENDNNFSNILAESITQDDINRLIVKLAIQTGIINLYTFDSIEKDLSITDSEKEQLLTQQNTSVYLERFNNYRQKLFDKTEWVRQRHADYGQLGLTDSTWDAWLIYWQALRDLPEQPNFDVKNPVWPIPPDEV